MNSDETPPLDIEAYESRIRKLEQELAWHKTYFEFVRATALEQRNAMSPIIGFSHLLLETTVLTEVQTEYVESLLYLGAYPLLHKNNRFVDINRVIAGKQELHPEYFDIRALLNQLIQDLSHLAARRKTTLVIEVDPQIAEFIEGDVSSVRQIFYDLVEGSIGYKPGKVEACLKLTQVEMINFLHFSIVTTAMRYSPESLAQLHKFFEAPTFQIELIPSHSLEMVRAKLFCDLMQGKIWVESQGEQGITFHFMLRYILGTA